MVSSQRLKKYWNENLKTMEVETASRTIRFKLNGQACSIASNPVTRTSDVLREELGLIGTKVGCDAGDCGACTILIDGEQRFACLTAAGQLEGLQG